MHQYLEDCRVKRLIYFLGQSKNSFYSPKIYSDSKYHQHNTRILGVLEKRIREQLFLILV